MDFAIEMQGFRSSNNCFTPKEVAVVSLNRSFTAHWVIAPTCAFSELPVNVRRENNWTTLYKHGIEWFEGEVSEEHFHANLRDLSKHAGTIYTCGREKAALLRQIMAREIINLDEQEFFPSFDTLPSSRAHCLLHCMKNQSKEFKCALNDSKRLTKWLINCAGKNLNIDIIHRYEHSGNTGFSPVSTRKLLRRLSSGSDTEGVDETGCSYS